MSSQETDPTTTEGEASGVGEARRASHEQANLRDHKNSRGGETRGRPNDDAVAAEESEADVVEATLILPPHDEPTSLQQDSRLHISSLWLPAAETSIGAIIPMIVGSFFAGPINVVFFFVLFIFLPVAAYHALRYFTLTYRIANGELIIQSGLLSRRERRIPLDRVQEVEIQQSLLHRLLGYAKVDISTAGSDTQEAVLNVLTKKTAEELKRAISNKQRFQPSTTVASVVEPAVDCDYACELDLRTLVIGGLTSKVVATLSAVVGAIVYFQLFIGVGDEWVNGFTDRVERRARNRLPAPELLDRLEPDLPDSGLLGFVADLWTIETLSKSILLAVIGLGIAVLAYVMRYHAFRLSRTGDMLSTSHGLLTYRHGSVSRDRIQALKLEESLLRRWFGLAAVRVDSAGDRNQVDENKNRDVLVPVSTIADAEEVARQAIPGLTELTPNWHRISPLAIKRGSKKGWLLATLVMLQTYVIGGWYCLMWLPAFPLVYLLNYKWYQHTGYWSSDDYLLVRQGWINRSTACVPVKNIQSVTLGHNFFDRRLDLASLAIDIAGQSNTGGGPRIRHLPVIAAESLQHRLAHRAAESEFLW